MKNPAKPCKLFSAVGILVLLVMGLAGQAFADTKPKFVYVANSGDPNPGDQYVTFQVTATASCTSSPCASTFTISGSLVLDLSLGQVYNTTLHLTDSSDLASSPLPLFGVGQPSSLPTNPETFPIYFTANGQSIFNGNPLQTNLKLYFPFTGFPGNYSGGPLCTSVSAPGCVGISGFTILAADMSPSLLATTGGNPITGTITTGSLTVVANTEGSNTVSGYAIDTNTGALTPLPGSPFTVGLNPYSLALDPSNKFLYVANRVSDNISAFAVNPTTGALSPITGSPFPAGSAPDNVVVDPSGKHVYVANQRSNDVWAYAIDSETGALTPINGSPFPAGNSPFSLTVDPLDRFLYELSYDPDIPWCEYPASYSIDSATGALTPLLGGQFYPEACTFSAVEDPLGKFFFGISYDFDVHWGVGPYEINGATGALSNTIYGDGSDVPSALAMHPSGKFLYVTDARSDYVTAYTIDSATGNMTRIPGTPYGDECGHGGPCYPVGPYSGPYATGSSPESIVIDPSGRFAYVGNMYSNNISAYTIDGTTGVLAPVVGSPFAAGLGPSSVAIVSASTMPFDTFKARAEIDEDRKTSFRVEGFFKLGAASNGIYPLSEVVQLQVGTFTATIPANSFTEKGHHEFEFEGTINGVNLGIAIRHVERKHGHDKHDGDKHDRDAKHDNDADHDNEKHADGNDYIFTAEGKGNILGGITNPVTVSLAIGDDEGSATVNADIDK